MADYKYDEKQAVKTTVRAIITDKAGRYFLIQRLATDTGGGMWQFVGGGVDEGQTPVEAIKREAKEEANLELMQLKKYKTIYNDVMKHSSIYFTAKAKGNVKLQAIEVQGYGWFTVEEAKQLPLTAGARKIIEGMQ
jgi:mutator protein MutT